MIGTYGWILAGLLGLVFGSFLNTCASRWPNDESAIKPRSHCHSCGRTLAWWENVPLLSWLALRGHCRTCKAAIGWRYPFVELAIAVLWAFTVWQIFNAAPELNTWTLSYNACVNLVNGIARMIFLWLLVALAVLDAENLWLPDRLTLPGIALGLVLGVTRATFEALLVFGGGFATWKHFASVAIVFWFLGAVVAAGVVLLIRFVYRMVRDQEGIGLGDVKLMAMIGGWLGIKFALLSLGIGVLFGAVYALYLLARPSKLENKGEAGQQKLPFGAYLCLGAIVSTFWATQIIATYQRLAGF